MRFGSANLVTNGSMSGTVTSWGMDLQQVWVMSIQALWSGSGSGTLKLQVSNDNVNVGPTGSNPATYVTNWTDYTGSSYSVTAAAGSSSFMWNVNYPGYRWVRAVYTASSGNGNLTINYFDKSS